MSELAKEITHINIEQELTDSYLDYAMSVIIGRALPDVRDGFKPVHRRILYAMKILGNDWNKAYKKSARVVGDVIGKYHPHGDTAVYDAIVRMAQPFSLRYMLVDGQGNFGSVDGDPPAAMRYTEIRMSKIAHDILADLDKDTVDFVLNYDETEQIPEVMPTRIPNLLINGSSGIAVGMATNIPPHNISEVIEACLAYIDDKNISLEALMKYMPGPDFPTAGIIYGRQGIEQAYRTGRGRIYIRAKAEIKVDEQSGRQTIIVEEIPYQVNKKRLIEKMGELVKEKRLEGISALRDESDKEGMRIVIELKRDAIGDVVLNQLYSLTQLQFSFGINMVALDSGRPKIMSLKDILRAFIRHRREVVTRRTLFELRKGRDRAHILEALAVALANIDPIIELIRHAGNPAQAKAALLAQPWPLGHVTAMLDCVIDEKNIARPEWLEAEFGIHDGKYHFTEQQAQAILDLRLQKLTGLEHQNLLDQYKALLNSILELKNILSDPDRLLKVIREEFLSIKTQYHDERLTEIKINTADIHLEDLIPQEDVVVTLSHQGYIKYQPLSDYEAQRRGGKGKSAARTKNEDFIECLLVANTHDNILCFSSRGRLYWLKVYQLLEASRGARGRPIINLLPLNPDERITAILPVKNYETGKNVFMATAFGVIKKMDLSEFSRRRSTGIYALRLDDGDALIGVDLTDGNSEVMLFSSQGKVIRFSENQIRTMGRGARGVGGIRLAEQDRVVSLIIPHGDGDILTVTANGYGKKTSKKEYPVRARNGKGVISIKVDKRNGQVVGAIQVDENDHLMMITDAGTLVRIRASEISSVSRNTKGVTLIRTQNNEQVVGLQRLVEESGNIDDSGDDI